MMSWVFLLLVCLSTSSVGLNWQENVRPKLFASMTARDFTAFVGNVSAQDRFTSLLYTDFTPESDLSLTSTTPSTISLNSKRRDSSPSSKPQQQPQPPHQDGVLLLGARNIVYKLSSSELRLKQTLVWDAAETARETCVVKGKNREVCQNFIVVLKQYPTDPSKFLVCGTNAFSPKCRQYIDERGGFVELQRSEVSGLGLAPLDPGQNSTAVLTENGDIYAGTVADFTGVDSLIFRYVLKCFYTVTPLQRFSE